MPSLPNAVSTWSGANLNIKNLDVVSLAADDVACNTLTVGGETIDSAVIADIDSILTKTQNISATHLTTNVAGDVYVSGNLDVTGGIEFSGDLIIDGDLQVVNDLTVDGQTTMRDDLYVHTDTLYVKNEYVGINNTDPQSNLDVTGDVNITSSTAIGGDCFITNDLVVDTDTLYVNHSNDRVGINTSAPAHSLDVVGDANVSSNVGIGGAATVTSDLKVNTDTLVVDTSTNRVGINKAVPTDDLDVDGTANISGMLSAFNDTLQVHSTKVGINNTSPTYDLDVTGSSRITNNITVGSSTLHVDGSNYRVGVNTTGPSYDLDVHGNTALRGDVRIDTDTLLVDSSNDRVGINTATPRTDLDVVGDTVVTGNCSIGSADPVSYRYPFFVNKTSATATPTVEVQDSNFHIRAVGSSTLNTFFATPLGLSAFNKLDSAGLSEAVTIAGGLLVENSAETKTLLNVSDNYECVGVGTAISANTYKLDVLGDTRCKGSFDVVNASNISVLSVDSPNNRVGVYTTTPSEALDVVGNLKFSGGLKIGSTDVITTNTTRIGTSSYYGLGCNLSRQVVIHGSTNPSGNTTGSITYGVTFLATPTVITTVDTDYSAGPLSCTISGRGTTSCNFRLSAALGTTSRILWIAIGLLVPA